MRRSWVVRVIACFFSRITSNITLQRFPLSLSQVSLSNAEIESEYNTDYHCRT